MNILHTNDTSFKHAPSSSWYNVPKKFVWSRDLSQDFEKIVITNLTGVNSFKNKRVYGWLTEPRELNSIEYEFAEKNFNLFEKIFTYDNYLLSKSDKFELLPFGGCWIDEEDRKIYEKNKLICSFVSPKIWMSGHKLRHKIVKEFTNIDFFGHDFNYVDKKIKGLRDYKFCVVVENQKIDYLFTEKIIDCFVTGTIPIYYGCPSISNFFDGKGILEFTTIEELKEILSSVTSELYDSLIDSVINNFEIAKKYCLADDLVYEKISNIEYLINKTKLI
jgi:hypothetical protein